MEKIENGKYEGWLWKSDSENPCEITKDKDLDSQLEKEGITFDDNKNPFIIEGMLWNEETMTSVSIKYVDGKHIINKHKVDAADLQGSEKATLKEFVPHRLPGNEKIKMLQYWKEEQIDEQFENLLSLQPDKLVFVGFKK